MKKGKIPLTDEEKKSIEEWRPFRWG